MSAWKTGTWAKNLIKILAPAPPWAWLGLFDLLCCGAAVGSGRRGGRELYGDPLFSIIKVDCPHGYKIWQNGMNIYTLATQTLVTKVLQPVTTGYKVPQGLHPEYLCWLQSVTKCLGAVAPSASAGYKGSQSATRPKPRAFLLVRRCYKVPHGP